MCDIWLCASGQDCLAFKFDLNRPSTGRSFGSSFFLGGIVAPLLYLNHLQVPDHS